MNTNTYLHSRASRLSSSSEAMDVKGVKDIFPCQSNYVKVHDMIITYNVHHKHDYNPVCSIEHTAREVDR
jgi:hypothetical protein